MYSPSNDSRDGHSPSLSPPTTTISGFSRIYEDRDDENLPEAYVDDAPRSVVPAEQTPATSSLPEKYEAGGVKPGAIQDDSLKTPVSPSETDNPRGKPAPQPDGTGEKRICGMKRWVFVTALAALLIIVAAAVGGGVGGTVGSSSSSEDDDGDDSPSTAETPTPTSDTAPTSSSATSTPTPEFLNNQTTPTSEFAFQGFSDPFYGGSASHMITKEGGTDFDFSVESYVWLPGRSGCCVSFCSNETMDGLEGWRCSARYREEASDAFTRVFVWCEENVSENAKCGES